MIEAMACGTPVIAFNRGSVNEVVTEGVTGFKVDNKTEMIVAINNLNIIDRSICRKTAEEQFDVVKIAHQYLSIT